MNRQPNNLNCSNAVVNWRYMVATAGTLAVLLATGLSCKHQTGSPCGISLVIAADTSRSNRTYLPQAVRDIMRLRRLLSPTCDRRYVLRFDSQAYLFAGPFLDQSPTQDQAELIAQLRPAAAATGTYTNKLVAQIDNIVAQSKNPAVIVVFFDGAGDKMAEEDHVKVHDLAQSLAASGKVYGFVIRGAQPSTWDGLKRDFAPLVDLLGDRFIISPPTHTDLSTIETLVEGARRLGKAGR